jgi:hypothetical protein
MESSFGTQEFLDLDLSIKKFDLDVFLQTAYKEVSTSIIYLSLSLPNSVKSGTRAK